MTSSRARTPLVQIALVAALLGFFPGVVGYVWAIGWLPVYGVACHFDKIFGFAINPDGYRIYLLGRDCDIDAAIRAILADSQFAAGQDQVDADQIVAIYRHKQLPVAGNESLASDLVQQKLREFVGSAPSASGCTPADRYCPAAASSDEDFISRWVRAWLSYVQSQFRFTVMDGADYISSLLLMGPVAQAIMAFCYLAALALAAERIGRHIFARYKTTASPYK